MLGWLDANGTQPERWKTPSQAASTSVWGATAPELEGIGGLYIEECRKAAPWDSDKPMEGVRDYARSPEYAERLCWLSDQVAA